MSVQTSFGNKQGNLATNWQQRCPRDRNATKMRAGAASPQMVSDHHFCNVTERHRNATRKKAIQVRILVPQLVNNILCKLISLPGNTFALALVWQGSVVYLCFLPISVAKLVR